MSGDESVITMLVAAVLAGLAAGKLRGGSLAAVGSFTPRIPWVVPLAFGIQVGMARAVGVDVPWWVLPLHLATYALLLTGIAANRGVPGAPLLIAGLALNTLAIAANDGLMPLAPERLSLNHDDVQVTHGQHIPRTKGVLLPREATRLWELTDVLALPEGLPMRGMFSVGDVAIVVGVGWSIQGLMRRPLPGISDTGISRIGESTMAINMQAAQLVVGAAALDARFRRLLLTHPERAVLEVASRPGTPAGSRLSEDDRRTLGAIRADSLSEFARGVERLGARS